MSTERADAVRTWQDAGIVVDAWLLLDKRDGYFATYDNTEAVRARVDAFLEWNAPLGIASLGFDFEPALHELDGLFATPFPTLGKWLLRSRNRERRSAALTFYGTLIATLRARGLHVESYQFPLLLEDRRAGGTFFQRLVGALDVPVDREVAMAYSSLLGPFGHGLVEQTAHFSKAIAVGSTGGGVDPLPALSWDELVSDLRVAAHLCRDISIFSLEGCVTHRYLDPLCDLDWGVSANVDTTQRIGASTVRLINAAVARLLG